MNYIGLLTKERNQFSAESLQVKSSKSSSRETNRNFRKYGKGFRAKSLTEQQALSIAISNIDKPFIATWVNIMVEHCSKRSKKI